MKLAIFAAAILAASPVLANGNGGGAAGVGVDVEAVGVGQSASGASVYQEASDPTRIAPSVSVGGSNNTAPCALVNGGGFAYGAPFGVSGFRSHQEQVCKTIWEAQQLAGIIALPAPQRAAALAHVCGKSSDLRKSAQAAGYCAERAQTASFTAPTTDIKGMTKPAGLVACDGLEVRVTAASTEAQRAEAVAFCKATR